MQGGGGMHLPEKVSWGGGQVGSMEKLCEEKSEEECFHQTVVV